MSTLLQSTTLLIRSVTRFTHLNFAAVIAAAPAGFQQIVTAINNVKDGVFNVATAVAVLMVIVAGMLIMVDREASMEKRGQRLAFLKTVLIGYAVVVGANFMLTLMKDAMGNLK